MTNDFNIEVKWSFDLVPRNLLKRSLFSFYRIFTSKIFWITFIILL